MENLKLSTLIPEEKIVKRIKEMGDTLSKKYNGEELVAVCILKGSFMFYADLIREIDTDVICEFCGTSSYGNHTKSNGEVRLTLDLASSIKDRHVLLIEDIVDTGLTMSFLQRHMEARQPKSLTSVALLHKPDMKKVDFELEMSGFEIGNDFVVGYGLDYQNHFRQLPYIACIQNFN